MKKSMLSMIAIICVLAFTSCKKDSTPELRTVVKLDGNIQDSIDRVAATGGGTVNLEPGTYTITKPLRMKTNVTLNGAGSTNTVITANTPMSIITTNTDGLSRITIQNLKIIGVANDSNSNGIIIASLNNYFHNIKITNVQVTNCGGMGIHIKRTDTAYVTGCNLNNNGKSVYYHNIYVRQSRNITVTGNTLTYSPHGTGLHIAGVCTNFIVKDNTVLNNGIAGMNIQDNPDSILVQHNTVNNNGTNHLPGKGDGISFTGTHALVDKNTANNNYETGIHTWGGNGSVTNNHASGNASNYNVHGTFTFNNNL